MTLTAPLPFDFELLLPPLPEDTPAHAQALAAKGAAALREGRYEEALEAFERATGLRADYPEAHYSRGVVLGQLGRVQEALEAFERATELRIDFPEAHYNRAVSLGLLGRYEEAIEAYEKAVEFSPGDAEAHFNCGLALAQLGRYTEALEALERVYPLRRSAAAVGPRICLAASYISLLFGLSALKRRSLPDLEAATKAFMKWRARARRDKQTVAFKQAVEAFKKKLAEEDMAALDDFMLSVKLASIKDPFDRWDAIAEEINKVWPKDLDAVEAIRRRRD